MLERLDFAMLHRPGEKAPGPLKHERYSVDFLVNGASLFEATKAGERDLCGCLWAGDPSEQVKAMNRRVAGEFTFEQPTEIRAANGAIAGNRVALFVCPECAGLGCGAITLEVARDGNIVRWSRFAYQNDWTLENGETLDDFECYASIGPFAFEWESYKSVIHRGLEAALARS
jgi:hypothetical protein